MKVHLGIGAALFLVTLLTGCHNGKMGCGCLGGSCGTSSVITPPPTYSVQIPNHGQTLASANQAPIPVAGAVVPGQVPYNAQNGWQTGTGSPSTLSTGTTLASNTATPVLPPTLPGGASYRDSVNYQSTIVDEQLDSTRLAATDASMVQPNVMTSLNPTPGGYQAGVYPSTGGYPPGQQPILVNGQVESSAPRYATPGVPYPGYGYPPQYAPQYGAPYNQAVLASSTTIYDPNAAANTANGGQNRETEGSFR